ncbi:outer membrane lipoprotein chaperone LolA [Cognatiluteimonas weifangensis]|uniref:Outer-membrane lipoprotein carrier protein n=1 Tax=Cognatiluteimonas weifangensis TaxID=2303539 RepID=A0A372DNY9_9GAMM|nr:outer membrane lipoprotein chaperone LolA [Luteimonas weifangensis]RFP61214.1 outer membrane lipoprotein chaperone LolA [Luteimonas weifangensis]
MRYARLPGLALVLVVGLAAGSADAGARDDLAAFTRGLQGLQGQFVQQVYDANGKLKESSSGRVALSTPRLFRWEYVKPYAQLIVADGQRVWVYDPDLQQVTRRAQGAAEQDSPLAALLDPSRLDRDYLVRETGTADGLAWLSLQPRQPDGAGFQSARLGFGAHGLATMQVVDALGQKTQIRFSHWQRNPDFAGGTFRFSPPKGVDVVGEG